MKITSYALVILFFCSGCAAFYKPVKPERFSYKNTQLYDDVNFAYRFDVLTLTKNKRYAKKEEKFDIDVVAVKITNNSDKVISFDEDIKFHMAGRELYPLENHRVTSKLKQTVLPYLLYSLLFLRIETSSSRTTIPLGAGIALGNVLSAASSNSSFKKEFSNNNLVGKMIPPNETVTGLVAFGGMEYGNLEISIIKEKEAPEVTSQY